jgi:hypothetical protein
MKPQTISEAQQEVLDRLTETLEITPFHLVGGILIVHQKAGLTELRCNFFDRWLGIRWKQTDEQTDQSGNIQLALQGLPHLQSVDVHRSKFSDSYFCNITLSIPYEDGDSEG